MASLAEFLDLNTIRRLQYAFSAVAETAICICGPDGTPYLDNNGQPLEWNALLLDDREHAGPAASVDTVGGDGMLRMPVVIEGEMVGCLAIERKLPGVQPGSSDETAWRYKLIHLMANVVGGLCRREEELRNRATELATLYNITAEFAGQHDPDVLLENIAKTVVRVLKARGCSIRLLSEDGEELTIKAVANLSKEYLNKGPVRVSDSKVDQEVLSTGKPVYIEDEGADPRVLYRAEAKREGIVSSLCVPMTYKNKPEGVIRVYMDCKYQFDWFEISLLRAIAAEAGAAMVNSRLNNVERQMKLAAEVQKRMFPQKSPNIDGLQIEAVYVPSQELSGDFYDFINLPQNNLGVAVCDVAGKGVRASLLMASIRGSLRAHAANHYEMSEVLDRVNRDLCADTNVNDFATMFYGVLNYKDMKLTYTNAGHVQPMLVRDNKVTLLSVGGGVIGIDPQAKYQQGIIDLRKGDVILAYTDGLLEAMNFAYETFGRERIEHALLDAARQPWTADRIIKHMQWAMRNFAGLQKNFDDMTIMVIRVP